MSAELIGDPDREASVCHACKRENNGQEQDFLMTTQEDVPARLEQDMGA